MLFCALLRSSAGKVLVSRLGLPLGLSRKLRSALYSLPCSLFTLLLSLFHLRRDHVPASEYRAMRARAFETWAEISEVTAAA